MKNKKIRIAITMGDPAGIGAEIIVKALSISRGNRVLSFTLGIK